MQPCSRQTSSATPRNKSWSRAAFTLNELLIVIALAVLILALAVPAFNVITGGRTIDSAENQISSYLSAARAEAIGLQEPRGVLLFEDVTGRVVALPVYYPPEQTRPVMELIGNREELSLPVGVGLIGVPNTGGSNNPPSYDQWPKYAVILFDSDGKLIQDGVRVATGTGLFNRLTDDVRTKLVPPVAAATPPPPSQTTNIGFVLFDKPAYGEQPASNQDKWMQENAVPYLVNRYNGTLLRAE